MVRKRSYKKYIVESEESDSDDFYEETASEDAQPKKYSLRERRGTNLAEDFDYDLLEEGDGNLAAAGSDDDEFNVKEVEQEEGESTNPRPPAQRLSQRPKIYKQQEPANVSNCTITKFKERELEPEIPKDKQSSDDMIDFEDVIRADILVNKSRIDYDSIIEKTEIKLEKNPKAPENKVKPTKVHENPVKLNKNGEPRKKRGRKPKQMPLDETFNTYHMESVESGNTGLPINSVLGETESLYELAQRYHMQGGSITDVMDPVSITEGMQPASITEEMEPTSIIEVMKPVSNTEEIEPLSKENISTESTESGFIENENESSASLKKTEAIETF